MDINQRRFVEDALDLLKKDAMCIDNRDAQKEHVQVATEFLKAAEATGDLADLSGTRVSRNKLATFFLRMSPSVA